MITIQCQCGEIYRTEERHIGKNIKCNKCGDILSIRKPGASLPAQNMAEIPQEKPATAVYPQKKPEPLEKEWWQKHLYSLIGVAILAGIIIFFLVMPERKPQIEPSSIAPPLSPKALIAENPQKKYSSPPIAPAEPVKPKLLPNGSSPFGPGISNGHSTITIDNGTETDALVLVVRHIGRKKLVRNFYIRQGRKWTATKIPPGDYILCVAFGMDWNSNLKEFNIEQGFSETKVFNVGETTEVEETEDRKVQRTIFSKITITLHPVLSGNFPSHKISKRDFLRNLADSNPETAEDER